jgi:hypothetical protein
MSARLYDPIPALLGEIAGTRVAQGNTIEYGDWIIGLFVDQAELIICVLIQ